MVLHSEAMNPYTASTPAEVLVTFAWPEHNLYVLLSEPGRRTPEQMYREAAMLRKDGLRVLCFEHHELERSPDCLVDAVGACIDDRHLTPAPWGQAPTLYVGILAATDPTPRTELEQLLRDSCSAGDQWIIVEPEAVERPELLRALLSEHVPQRPDAEISFVSRDPAHERMHKREG